MKKTQCDAVPPILQSILDKIIHLDWLCGNPLCGNCRKRESQASPRYFLQCPRALRCTSTHMHSHTLVHAKGSMKHGIDFQKFPAQTEAHSVCSISHGFPRNEHFLSARTRSDSLKSADFQAPQEHRNRGRKRLIPDLSIKLQPAAAGHWLTRVLIRSVGWADKASCVKHKGRSLTLTQHYETPMLQQQLDFSQNWNFLTGSLCPLCFPHSLCEVC